MSEKLQPGLYIVATPIGNLSDLSPRAADILARADAIAVEDSRVTAKLLQHIGVRRTMLPYHDHNADRVRPGLIERMRGEAVALVVGPPGEAPGASEAELDAALGEAMLRLSPSRAAAEVAERLGVQRRLAYERAQRLK